MASGTKSKGSNKGKPNSANKARRSVVGTARKPKPWGMIMGIIVIVALAGGVFTYAFMQIADKKQWVPAADNQDPSTNIADVVRKPYKASQHVNADQRVAYDQAPPFGGPHDNAWAVCTGMVYPTAVRNENMVHSLEHGAVWIAYNPDKIKGKALDTLKAKVEGKPYMLMSPYPGLDKPISLQSWGHQLKLTSATDSRIEEFIKSLRSNPYQSPEKDGSCEAQPGGFDPAAPPPFVAEKPGAGAVTMDGKGATNGAGQEQGGGTTPPATGAGTPPPSQ
jgi:hypothetical protein